MKRGKMHRFIKDVLSEQSILLDRGTKLNISEQSTKKYSRADLQILKDRVEQTLI